MMINENDFLKNKEVDIIWKTKELMVVSVNTKRAAMFYAPWFSRIKFTYYRKKGKIFIVLIKEKKYVFYYEMCGFYDITINDPSNSEWIGINPFDLAEKYPILWDLFTSEAIKHNTFFLNKYKNNNEGKLEFIKECGLNIQWILNPTPEMKLEAVKQYGPAIRFIANQTEELQLEAIKNHEAAILWCINPSKKVLLEATKVSSVFVFKFKDILDDEIIQSALLKIKDEIVLEKNLDGNGKMAIVVKNSNRILVNNPSKEILDFVRGKEMKIEEILFEEPMHHESPEIYKNIVSDITELKNREDVKITELDDNLFKMESFSRLFYWFGDLNDIQLACALDKDKNKLIVRMTGKNSIIPKKSPPYASNLYILILNDESNKELQFLSDDMLSSEGYSVWKKFITSDYNVAVYNKTNNSIIPTVSVDEMNKYMRKDSSGRNYQFVLSRK
jgi:hypothetical protein